MRESRTFRKPRHIQGGRNLYANCTSCSSAYTYDNRAPKTSRQGRSLSRPAVSDDANTMTTWLDIASIDEYVTSMERIPSTTTLLPLSKVAEAADVTRQTVYNWLDAGIISHKYDVDGSPVFTKDERDDVVRIAHDRRELLAGVRLPKRR